MPTRAELSDRWRGNASERNAAVRADFNGDGRIDRARLLVRADGQGFGLMVSLAGHKRDDPWLLVYVDNDMEQFAATGIAKVSAGRYKTACGKGYWSCRKGEKPRLTLAYDAIEYFKTESAASYFFFNPQKNAFERIWISD